MAKDTLTSYDPFFVDGADRPARWLITCDHAANTVPEEIAGGDLGLAPADMERHIAYDVGAAGVAREIGRLLDAPVILSNFSRLVIDPNRGEDDPTLVMRLYDGTIVPANRHVTADDVEHRKALCYRPYHTALERLAARRDDTLIVAVHSFTAQLKGHAPRPWEVGVLFSQDERLARPVLDHLHRLPHVIGENEPYSGHLPGDSIDRHALTHGRPHVLIEVRNDLIVTDAEQVDWGGRLAEALAGALADGAV
ncbi:N-formylglutamate amidohydrolase [Rhodobacteraceae bacterium CCMM004]|nr:N-formylglutamate amidohydrolase [Rhodobacteraceae bacterium CCMM004]